jgi:hypothetical protein
MFNALSYSYLLAWPPGISTTAFTLSGKCGPIGRLSKFIGNPRRSTQLNQPKVPFHYHDATGNVPQTWAQLDIAAHFQSAGAASRLVGELAQVA